MLVLKYSNNFSNEEIHGSFITEIIRILKNKHDFVIYRSKNPIKKNTILVTIKYKYHNLLFEENKKRWW